MKKLLLLYLFFGSLISMRAQTVVPDQTTDEIPIDRFDVSYYQVPPSFSLTPKAPLSVLPFLIIDQKNYRIVSSLDTVRMEHVFDSISNPTAICFKPTKKGNQQTIAVKRKNDWLLLDWTVFRLAAPIALKMSWKDIGTGHPVLMFSMSQMRENGNIEQEVGSMMNNVTQVNHYTNSWWKKAQGFCLLDVERVAFIVDNLYSGYEYSYSQTEFLPVERDAQGIPGPSATKNERLKYFKVWYDIKILPGRKSIDVRLKQCEQGVTFDPSIHYSYHPEKDQIEPVRTVNKSNTCTKMLKEGVYQLEGGKFVWKSLL